MTSVDYTNPLEYMVNPVNSSGVSLFDVTNPTLTSRQGRNDTWEADENIDFSYGDHVELQDAAYNAEYRYTPVLGAFTLIKKGVIDNNLSRNTSDPIAYESYDVDTYLLGHGYST